jgi:hypothetical protein
MIFSDKNGRNQFFWAQEGFQWLNIFENVKEV